MSSLDDDVQSGGTGILKIASECPVSADSIVIPKRQSLPKNLWGIIYTLDETTGKKKLVIVDEVRLTVWVLLFFACLVAVGFLIADFSLGRVNTVDLTSHGHGIAILIGAVFSLAACVLTSIQISQHWKHWTHPPSQRLVVRILLMVPVYAISALASLTFLDLSVYIDFSRMCYEAFVIYTFMILLTKYLGGHNGVVEWMKYKPKQRWPEPFCCIAPVQPDSRFLYWLKYGALQYTIITPVISLAAVVLSMFGAYEDGVFEWANGYPYIAFIQNCSQLVSLYCLVWLYICMKHELAPFGPVSKFLVVKSVVFFTFWQGVGLAILAHMGVIQNTDEFSVGEVQVGYQDFLVCIEMFIAAAVHKYTFGHENYADGTLRLLMEQRGLYLAEISYKRALEKQRQQEAALLAARGLTIPQEAPPQESTSPKKGEIADAAAGAAVVAGAAAAATSTSQSTSPSTDASRPPMLRTMSDEQVRTMLAKTVDIDDDNEGDILFDDNLVDWRSSELPQPKFDEFDPNNWMSPADPTANYGNAVSRNPLGSNYHDANAAAGAHRTRAANRSVYNNPNAAANGPPSHQMHKMSIHDSFADPFSFDSMNNQGSSSSSFINNSQAHDDFIDPPSLAQPPNTYNDDVPEDPDSVVEENNSGSNDNSVNGMGTNSANGYVDPEAIEEDYDPYANRQIPNNHYHAPQPQPQQIRSTAYQPNGTASQVNNVKGVRSAHSGYNQVQFNNFEDFEEPAPPQRSMSTQKKDYQSLLRQQRKPGHQLP